MSNRSDNSIAAWIALFLFGVYLLSFSGRLYSQDSMLMVSVAESAAKRGEFSADQMWTLYKARGELGPDGEAYSKTGYGASLFALPLYLLALAVPGLGLVQTTLLSSAGVIALTGALVFLSARRLKYPRGVSVAAALLFGLATPAWVYAKQFWSEPFSLCTLFAAFYFLLRYRETFANRDALMAGLALGLAVATRVTNAALVPFFALYGFYFARRDVRARRGLFLFGVTLALSAASIAWYDWGRYGSALATGYRADETFDNPILLGLYGLLFSPGKGLFVFMPFLAALPWSAAAFCRRARHESLLILAVSAIYLILFSTWYYWWGGTNWGPRFLVPLIPFLVLSVAPALEIVAHLDVHKKTWVVFAAIFSALCILSAAIQLIGITIPSLAWRLRMVRLSPNPDMDAIFLPPFSPLVGYFNLLTPSALDFAWIRVI
ncbi:MAG: glycosyltransferase family 39 protein, partial [Chloroflexota bacterium]|nr:glycosyltransferase family 39 protein [Chloroflexota bacterium]